MLSVDIENAFNSIRRSKIMEKLLSNPKLKRIWQFFYWSYNEGSDLFIFDRDGNVAEVLKSLQGVKQGDPLAAFAFAFTIQYLYNDALKCANQNSVTAAAVLDDFTLVGDYQEVFKVYDAVLRLAPAYGLRLQVSKCKVLMPLNWYRGYKYGIGENKNFDAIIHQCHTRSLHFGDTLKILGVMIGTGTDDANHDILQFVQQVVDSHNDMLRLLSHRAMPSQCGLLLLRLCYLPSLIHLIRCMPPDTMQACTISFDDKVRDTLCSIIGINGDHPLNHKELAQIQLPISYGGLGLRSMLQTCHAAYAASLLPILPHIRTVIPSNKAYLLSSPVHQSLAASVKALFAQGIVHDDFSNWTGIRFNLETDPDMHSLWNDPVPMVCQPNDIAGASKVGFKLQSLLSRKIASVELEQLRNSLPPDDPMRIRLLSASQPGAGLWQVTLPTEAAFRMSNNNFIYATRYLLGRIPSESLLNKQCLCGARLNEVATSHFHDCHALPTNPTMRRHNMVVDSVLQFMKECDNEHGFSIIAKEPSANIYADVNKPATCKERADIVLVNNSISAMIDVAVVNPSSDGRSHIPGIYTTPMVSMKQTYDKKIAVHGGAARSNSLKMVPFILEAYGSLHADAQSLIDSIARSACYNATDFEVRELALRARALISIALQNGNGMVSECGISSAKVCTDYFSNRRSRSSTTSTSSLYGIRNVNNVSASTNINSGSDDMDMDDTASNSDPNFAPSLCINKALSSFASASAAASSAALSGVSVSSLPASSFASLSRSASKSNSLRLLKSALLDSQVHIAPIACSYAAGAGASSSCRSISAL